METEIKVEVADFETVRARLRDAGATFVSVSDEENVYLDRRDELGQRRELLRLRRDERARLTWKGPTDVQGGVRSRPEIEFTASSFDDALELLERLGFQPTERLTKHRFGLLHLALHGQRRPQRQERFDRIGVFRAQQLLAQVERLAKQGRCLGVSGLHLQHCCEIVERRRHFRGF